ncbi:hypothetical protein QFZ49_003600 [Streptomyces turgidiscabies]|uniref:Uncharacterized protein n=1 Tax=Streptomyces turgidiscabies TaxID=85558 RepID=A0ABU0RRU7_9ACTN|nr:hypothetical protein [Streptomyces turgidiscabies]
MGGWAGGKHDLGWTNPALKRRTGWGCLGLGCRNSAGGWVGKNPQANARPTSHTTGAAVASGSATPAVKWTNLDG